MERASSRQYPEREMSGLLAEMKAGGMQALRSLDTALRDFPKDGRLHFLKGSVLAGDQDYQAAQAAMARAVDLAPQLHVARFQLGFLQLTSGEAAAAQETWSPLQSLPTDHYLRIFVDGLGHLIRDDFAGAIGLLRKGISLNDENPVMNSDMGLVINQASELLNGGDGQHKTQVSSVDFFLQQAASRPKR